MFFSTNICLVYVRHTVAIQMPGMAGVNNNLEVLISDLNLKNTRPIIRGHCSNFYAWTSGPTVTSTQHKQGRKGMVNGRVILLYW